LVELPRWFSEDASHYLPNAARRTNIRLSDTGGRLKKTNSCASDAAAGTSPAGLVLLDDSRKCAQSFVDFARVREHRRHIGLQHHDCAACRITRSIFVGTSVTEIVLWQDLVLFDRSRFSLIPFSLHNLSVPEALPAVH